MWFSGLDGYFRLFAVLAVIGALAALIGVSWLIFATIRGGLWFELGLTALAAAVGLLIGTVLRTD